MSIEITLLLIVRRPYRVSEETFWRNYFYRVSLIKQNPDFTTATSDGGQVQRNASSGRKTASSSSWASSRSSSSEGPDDPAAGGTDASESEFISDSAYQAAANVSVEEVRKDMYKLGITKGVNNDGKGYDRQSFTIL